MQVSKIYREKLLVLENPRHAEIIAKYNLVPRLFPLVEEKPWSELVT
jgi:hypothetical protein